MKRKIKVIIEKTNTGYSAFTEAYPIGTTGNTIQKIKRNIVKAINLYNSEVNKRLIAEKHLTFQMDLASFFHYYKVLNAKALGERIGMHQSLLAQYISGRKTPSVKQMNRIIEGVHDVANELLELKIA
jgi:hypothetical protein